MAGSFDIGKVTGQIILEDLFSAAIDVANFKLEDLDKKLGGFGSHIVKSAAGFLTAEAAISAFKGAVSLASDTIQDLTIRGAEVSDVTDNFENLTKQAGLLGETLLNELNKGTHNTIDNLTLMKEVNQDLAAGLNLSTSEFKTLADGAFALAQATGEDVATAFSKMNDAMLTGQTRTIKLLTGTIDLEAAQDRYAKSLGTTAERLTADEKLQANRVAILESVAKATERIGEQSDGLDEIIAQMAKTWRDFRDELGKSIAESPVLVSALTSIRDIISSAFGGNTQTAVQTVTRLIEDLAISAVEFGQTVSDGVGIAARTWYSFSLILREVVQGYRAIAIAIQEVDLLKQKALEALGFSKATDAIKILEANLDSLYTKLAEGQAAQDAAKVSADNWSVATGKVNDVLETVKQRMIAAREAQDAARVATDEATASTEAATAATSDYVEVTTAAGDTLRMTKEELKAYDQAMQNIVEANQVMADGLKGIQPEAIKLAEKYHDLGVSVKDVSLALGLTEAQVKKINKAHEEQAEALKKANEAAKEQKEAMDEVRVALGQTENVLAGVGSKTRDLATEALKLGVSTDTVAKAFGITKAQAEALKAALSDLGKTGAAAGQALANDFGVWIDKAKEKMREFREQLNKTHQETLSLGGSFDVQALTKEQIATQGGEAVLKAEVAKLEQLYAQYPGRRPGGSGPTGIGKNDSKGWDRMLEEQRRYLTLKASGFRQGGAGDFGDGTLVNLHGKELIVPLDNAMNSLGMGGGVSVNNTFYVNGTGEQVARFVKDQIMRDLSMRRQLPSRS